MSIPSVFLGQNVQIQALSLDSMSRGHFIEKLAFPKITGISPADEDFEDSMLMIFQDPHNPPRHHCEQQEETEYRL